MSKYKKYYSKEDALALLQRYCVYQDRCHKEVKSKLVSIGVYGDDLDEILVSLIQDDFLNEERFARSFARGKFRIKNWGRIKIRLELKARGVSDYCIKKGMSEIDEADYENSLHNLLAKKSELLSGTSVTLRKQKIFKYALQKGYESHLIQKLLRDLT